MKAKYYDSIDNCPIILFIQISQGKKESKALCYEGEAKDFHAEKAWSSIYDEYISEFGVSAEYKHYTRERVELCKMLEGFFVRGEVWQRMLIQIKRHEIKQLEAQMSTGESDFNVLIGKLSKKMGFGINPSGTTVRQFYSYIKAI